MTKLSSKPFIKKCSLAKIKTNHSILVFKVCIFVMVVAHLSLHNIFYEEKNESKYIFDRKLEISKLPDKESCWQSPI